MAVVGVVAAAVVIFVLVYFEPQTLFIDDEVHETIPGLAAVTVSDPAAGTTSPTQAGTSPVSPTTVADSATPTTAAGAPTTTAIPTPAPPANSISSSLVAARTSGQPVVVSTGSFFSGEHETTGTALVVALPDGSIVIRFEDLDTSNGPDLRVVVSPDQASESWKYNGRIHLGELKGNIGDQNYSVAPEIDLTKVKSVVIWCERFSVAFGAAAIDVQA